jgi:dethiobiotin synthetase
MNKFFITGIGTDVGKTVCSAIITKALNADYWKPIQAGDLENSDSIKVKNLLGTGYAGKIHKEAFKLTQPMSPHAAAKIDGLDINILDIKLPETNNSLIVEGAGGLLVPINSTQTVADLIYHLNIPTIVVSRNYLGSINHTLLTVEALKNRSIPIAGILFNGPENLETQTIILKQTNLISFGRIDQTNKLDEDFINKSAKNLLATLNKIIS